MTSPPIYIGLYNGHILKRKYSSISSAERLNKQINLHPFFISGFIDGEGSFVVKILKNKR